MIHIKYVDGGNAIRPQGEGLKYIIHCCNDIGGWGSGFVLAINDRWTDPKDYYKAWSRNDLKGMGPFKLGQIQEVGVALDISVINMIGQRGVGSHDIVISEEVVKTIKPIRYEAIDECLTRVAKLAIENKASIHCPKFGAGLAGGDWATIEGIIHNNLIQNNIEVTVYNYKP